MSTSKPDTEGHIERRIDPEKRLGLDFHAPRALTRFNHLDSEARRKEIAIIATFREGDAMRKKLLQLVDHLEGRVSLEQQEFIDLTSGQYDAGYNAWKSAFQLPADALKTLATKDTVMQWAATVPAETIEGIKRYGPPRLKLLPALSAKELMQIMDANPKIPNQKVGKIWWNEWNDVTARAGSFGVTAEVADMPLNESILWTDLTQKDDQHRRTNEQMVAAWKQEFEQIPRTSSMPRDAYMGSIMETMSRRGIWDEKTWVAFDRPQGADVLPVAGWNSDHVRVDGHYPGNSYDLLRSRLWVEGRKV